MFRPLLYVLQPHVPAQWRRCDTSGKLARCGRCLRCARGGGVFLQRRDRGPHHCDQHADSVVVSILNFDRVAVTEHRVTYCGVAATDHFKRDTIGE